MKRVNNIYNEVYKLDNIIKMTDKVLSKIKNKEKKEKFLLYKSEHIINIKQRLESKDFVLGKYNIFLITDPKCRVVMSQNIEDKIINHLVAHYFLVKVYDNSFIDSVCATRIARGSSYAIKLMKKYLNEMKLKNDNFYVLKIDIKKYFYNIDHDILKNILRKKIKDRDALNVLDKIIDSTNESYINKRISNLKEKRINYLKSDKLITETEIFLYINMVRVVE